MTQWLTGRPTSYEDYVERYGTPERLASTLVVELGDTIIGDLFLGVEAPYSQVEVRDRAEGSQAAVGWLLDPAYVGHGYATEAAAEVLRICFEELGLRRVVKPAPATTRRSPSTSSKRSSAPRRRPPSGRIRRTPGPGATRPPPSPSARSRTSTCEC